MVKGALDSGREDFLKAPVASFILPFLTFAITFVTGGVFGSDFAPAYLISLKAARYLALPCLMADLYNRDATISTIHLLSGLVPFAMALAGNDNPQLGNLMVAANIVSLAVYSLNKNREWGWYTAAAGVVAYFLVPQSGLKVLHPLGLALMEYCAYRLFHIHVDEASAPQRGRRRPPQN